MTRRGTRYVSVARERSPGYGATAVGGTSDSARSPAAAAVAALDAALAQLADVDWTREDNASVRAASVELQRRVNQFNAQALRPVEQLEARAAYSSDGAVSAASWLRSRTNMDPAVASRTCTAARRLRGLPLLWKAFERGDVSMAHVTAVTEAAVPTRYASISSVEAPLLQLAATDKPGALRTALRAVRDIVDPDGSDGSRDLPEPEVPDGSDDDPRRYWHHSLTVDGLYSGNYLVGGTLGELISTMFDAFSTADPAELPRTSRRAPQQKRVDAMRAALMALCNAGLPPTIQGSKAHLLGMFDLLKAMSAGDACEVAGELRRTGTVSRQTLARIGVDAKFTPVLTMGGYRVVAVGRTYRTLPPWLRPMLEMVHRQCRGPDCDRPAAWAEAAHETDYAKGGNTDLNETIPLCKAHHDLVTYGRWAVRLDLDTGTCTWTAPDGRTITTSPPR